MDCFGDRKSGNIRRVDQLLCMQVFVHVAQDGGFAAAARSLRMSPAAVTKHVAALESRLGTRLFDRTTRNVATTEAGRLYLERCLECLHSLEDADAAVAMLAGQAGGVLRVTAPIDFGASLGPVLVRVMHSHPGIVIDLRLSNRVVDMVEEGVDVGVRIAPSLDGAYVARPLARSRLVVVGSREYFCRHGRPLRPEDLASHRCFAFTEPRPMQELTFVRDRQEVSVRLNVVMMSNNGASLMDAMRHGAGLCVAPTFMAWQDLAQDRVETVLPDWTLPEYRVFAVYPHRRFLSPKVRVFLDELASAFGDGSRDPWG